MFYQVQNLFREAKLAAIKNTMDNHGKDFTSNKFAQFCSKNGIRKQLTIEKCYCQKEESHNYVDGMKYAKRQKIYLINFGQKLLTWLSLFSIDH